MATTKIEFYRLVQDSQEYGSNDDHMISRVFFRVSRDGGPETEAYADMKQTVGAPWSLGAIEVGNPVGYEGRPWNHLAFTDAAREYFGRFLNIAEGTVMILRMRNNKSDRQQTFEFNTD